MNRHDTRDTPRSLEFALFAVGLLWYLASRTGAESAAQGIAGLVRWEPVRPLLNQLFFLILLLTGYTALHWLATRNASVRAGNALPSRKTAGREWQLGAALGWGLLLLAILPMAVVGDLHPQFWLAPSAWGEALLSLLTLLAASLATEIAFRAFLFERLIAATGPVTATVALSTVYAITITSPMTDAPFSFIVAFASGVLFSVAYLRTHAVWLGWGLRFGWWTAMVVLFGLPLAASTDFPGVVMTDSSGRTWLTGGPYGPEGAAFTALVLLAGAVALFPVTRDYAWMYTHPVIVPGGFPMEVPPPAAHTAMETAPVAQPLVQIAGLPTSRSAYPETASPGPDEAAHRDNAHPH